VGCQLIGRVDVIGGEGWKNTQLAPTESGGGPSAPVGDDAHTERCMHSVDCCVADEESVPIFSDSAGHS
jgi:hypothetical protein